MKGLVKKIIEEIRGSISISISSANSAQNKKTPLKHLSYIPETKFIDGLNNKTIIPEVLDFPMHSPGSLSQTYLQRASKKRFLRKREFYYTHTKRKIVDPEFDPMWKTYLNKRITP
tara:strand:- start:227 stop:574 length:348 start_codon:yes stop_codon:yes gene_type:complete